MSVTNTVPVSEARDRLTGLLADAVDHDVVLLKHGHPVGVLLSVDRYESIVGLAEDMEDMLAARAAQEDEFVPFTRSTVRSSRA